MTAKRHAEPAVAVPPLEQAELEFSVRIRVQALPGREPLDARILTALAKAVDELDDGHGMEVIRSEVRQVGTR